MEKRILYGCWAGLFILCAGLGFIPSPEGAKRIIMILLALAFFIPGALILYLAVKAGDRKEICRIRNLSILSLAVTVVMIIVNFLSVTASDAAGAVLHGLLIVVSSPMICGQNWIMSLFLWACLLMSSLSFLKRFKREKRSC